MKSGGEVAPPDGDAARAPRAGGGRRWTRGLSCEGGCRAHVSQYGWVAAVPTPRFDPCAPFSSSRALWQAPLFPAAPARGVSDPHWCTDIITVAAAATAAAVLTTASPGAGAPALCTCPGSHYARLLFLAPPISLAPIYDPGCSRRARASPPPAAAVGLVVGRLPPPGRPLRPGAARRGRSGRPPPPRAGQAATRRGPPPPPPARLWRGGRPTPAGQAGGPPIPRRATRGGRPWLPSRGGTAASTGGRPRC